MIAWGNITNLLSVYADTDDIQKIRFSPEETGLYLYVHNYDKKGEDLTGTNTLV